MTSATMSNCPLKEPQKNGNTSSKEQKHPFQIIPDHKNLDYINNDKRLNPWKAWWTLFFTCFQFTVTYHFWDKEQQRWCPFTSPQPSLSTHVPWLHPATIHNPCLIKEIRQVQHLKPPPPPTKHYVPDDLLYVFGLFTGPTQHTVQPIQASTESQPSQNAFWWPPQPTMWALMSKLVRHVPNPNSVTNIQWGYWNHSRCLNIVGHTFLSISLQTSLALAIIPQSSWPLTDFPNPAIWYLWRAGSLLWKPPKSSSIMCSKLMFFQKTLCQTRESLEDILLSTGY